MLLCGLYWLGVELSMKKTLNLLMRKPFGYFFVFFGGLMIFGVGFRLFSTGKLTPTYEIHGQTMGTTYSIVLHGKNGILLEQLKKEIEIRLNEINRSMSTWIEDSEISKINSAPANQWLDLSSEFSVVLEESLILSQKTSGAFDVTIGPVVNLWGFGPTAIQKAPSSHEVQMALQKTGYKNLVVSEKRLKKLRSGMYLDFSAIAPGYAVDEVASVLMKKGIENQIR